MEQLGTSVKNGPYASTAVRLSKDELRNRDKKIIDKICSDENYAYYFIHEMCRPLLSKIIWTIYNNDAEYDELVNTLYVHLKKPSEDGIFWNSLRIFDFRTSLFDYIKTIAVRLFYSPSEELFSIPESLLDSGMAEQMILKIDVALYRKYFWYRYIAKDDVQSIAEKLQIDVDCISRLSRMAIKKFKKTVQNYFPEYIDELFHVEKQTVSDIENVNQSSVSIQPSDVNGQRIDALAYLSNMPNERYRMVLSELFINEKTPEDVAALLHTPVSNIYNIKRRAIDQLRDIVLYFKDIENFEYHINKVKCDRYRELLLSIFVKKENYDSICSQYGLSEAQFKHLKKEAIKELKNVIFKK